MRARRSSLVGGTGALALVAGLAVGLPTASQAAEPTVPFISEIHYDNTGGDAGEFVEVQVPAGTSTAGWSIVLYNGTGGAVYDTDALPAVTAPAGGPSAVAVIDYPVNGIQNGSPDGIALVDAATRWWSSCPTREPSPRRWPGGRDDQRRCRRVRERLRRRRATACPSGSTRSRRTTSGRARRRTPRVRSTRRSYLPVEQCDLTPSHEIGAVQGSGFSTPLAGQVVSVRGVVVGDVPGLGGFYLQDDGDADAATSDGIFVATSAAVGLGDTVAVAAAERELRRDADHAGRGRRLPARLRGDLPAAAALDLPAGSAAREPLEGMLVAPVDTLTVSEVFDLTRFGELMLSEGGRAGAADRAGRRRLAGGRRHRRGERARAGSCSTTAPTPAAARPTGRT